MLSWPIVPPKAVAGLCGQDIARQRAVKNARISLFNLAFTHVFTPWPRTLLKENAMPESNPERSVWKTTKTGESDATSWAFSHPKVRGVAPALFNTTQQLHCRVHRRGTHESRGFGRFKISRELEYCADALNPQR